MVAWDDYWDGFRHEASRNCGVAVVPKVRHQLNTLITPGGETCFHDFVSVAGHYLSLADHDEGSPARKVEVPHALLSYHQAEIVPPGSLDRVS